ncbi:MAG: pyroglutamyl-peptidase I [Burkholderiales bacterium]|uniref:pyroglutamyl-peptidase I n=1 Tax=Ottowia sp. TaxID=1898956 RepID=UPI001AC20A6F|nr:pyroglutamyl-peptidase I [Ottowia sp.]MBN9406205.1 pyroglutamyl-peptidase I [Burkholderiales bacterium]MBS0404596.1 pyroglutamyl-peptidase I [Pseudomonadota bacterium]HMN56886.1 pyroglutamyl-peptidase I [Ottowia sp.]
MVAPSSPRPSTQYVAERKPVLLTGFDAFDGDAINPSWLAARALHRRRIAGHAVLAAQLPTQFGASLARLRALLAQHRPALVICLGLAGSRSALSLERVAINVDDARIADNAGARPIDTPVVADAPVAYFSRLPIKSMHAAIQAAGIAVEVSQSAGTFVCNHVFYGLMHQLATARGFARTRGGFIHVPPLPEQAAHGMPLAQMVEGLRIGIRTALTVTRDARHGAGAVD